MIKAAQPFGGRLNPANGGHQKPPKSLTLIPHEVAVSLKYSNPLQPWGLCPQTPGV